MDTKSLTADSEPLIPDLKILSDALVGGFAVLDDETSTHAYWSIFSPHDLSFFNIPLLYQLKQRPYHAAMMKGPFDTKRLAKDYHQHLYRSEVACNRKSNPSVERLLLCLGEGVFALYENLNLHVFAPTPQAAAKAADELRRYEIADTKDKPGF